MIYKIVMRRRVNDPAERAIRLILLYDLLTQKVSAGDDTRAAAARTIKAAQPDAEAHIPLIRTRQKGNEL